MPQHITEVAGIGRVILVKRRGTKNIRLSITPAGIVRVGLPSWISYSAGITFAISRRDWIKNQICSNITKPLAQDTLIGKSYRLRYINDPESVKISTRLDSQNIKIKSSMPLNTPVVQTAARAACERALRKEAANLLSIRLIQLSNQYNLPFRTLKIKKMARRWGSCSSDKSITLNFFLLQLPWRLIDYVLIHELIHTKYLNHSSEFWKEFELCFPGAKKTRKLLNTYRPVI